MMIFWNDNDVLESRCFCNYPAATGDATPGAPQAGVVAEPLPRKLPGIIQELFICIIEDLFPPPLERVCGEQNMRQHARPGQLVQQVGEVEQLQVQRRLECVVTGRAASIAREQRDDQ